MKTGSREYEDRGEECEDREQRMLSQGEENMTRRSRECE